jgi:hypothetical protein
MSSSTYLTLSMTIPLYNTLIDHIEDTVGKNNIKLIIREAASICKDKLLQYYNKTNETYLVATVLDPRLKLQYYKDNNWEEDLLDDINKM